MAKFLVTARIRQVLECDEEALGVHVPPLVALLEDAGFEFVEALQVDPYDERAARIEQLCEKRGLKADEVSLFSPVGQAIAEEYLALDIRDAEDEHILQELLETESPVRGQLQHGAILDDANFVPEQLPLVGLHRPEALERLRSKQARWDLVP